LSKSGLVGNSFNGHVKMVAFNVDDVTAKLKNCDIGHEIIYKRETTSTMDDAEDGARQVGKQNSGVVCGLVVF